MKKILSFFVLFCFAVNANAADLTASLQKTYLSCVGIDDMLSDMKKIAGINTAVTGVGTVAGGAALIVGIKKNQELFGSLKKIEDKGGVVYSGELTVEYQKNFEKNLKSTNAKKLGNWRTGLLAVNAATNVAGAILATKNTNNEGLDEKIQSCISALDELHSTLMQARAENIDISEANAIYNACSEYKYIDLSVIQKRAKGAQISSIIGGGVGVAGAVTSHIANNSTEADKMKNLDTVSNVLAGGATALSGAATVFNATQISAIKKVANVAQQCESLLK